MRARIRALSTALILLAPIAAFAGPAEEANEAVDRWAAAYNSNDPDAIAKLYTPDAILLGTVSPIISEGLEAIRSYYSKKGSGNSNTIGERRTIVVDENAAVVTGFYDFTRMLDRLPVPTRARFTMLLVKRDGEWRIAHHHSSPRPY
jgi:uncharacterized protein (TIGR02246 family)